MAEAKMIDVFREIWATREHRSEISDSPLLPYGHPMWHWQMSHILCRSTYPRLKLSVENIILVTWEEHLAYEHWTERSKKRSMYILHAEKWEQLFARKQELKERYHQENKILK